MCELIIAAPLVFSGGSSRISLRLSPGWDHRAGIVLACGEPTEMGECPSFHFLLSPLIFLFLISLYLPSLLQSAVMFRAFSPLMGFPLNFLVSVTHSPCPTHLPTTPPPVSLHPSFHPVFIPPHHDINRPVLFDGFG